MILYTVIARTSDGSVLVECTLPGVEGNHPQITHELISAVRRNPTLVINGNRRTFAYKAFTNAEDMTPSNTAPSSSSGNRAPLIQLLPNPMDGLLHGFQAIDGFLDKVVAEVVTDDDDDDENDDDEYHHRHHSNTLPIAGKHIKATTVMSQNSNNNKTAFLGYYFHVTMGESVMFICLSDDSLTRQQNVNFSFLQELAKNFTSLYTPNKIQKAIAYGMEQNFSNTLQSLMHHYNTYRMTMLDDPNVLALKAQVESLKNTMDHNIVLAMSREHKLEQLIQKSDAMEQSSKVFTKRAKTARRIVWRKKLVCKILIILFIGLLIYFFFAMICSFDGHRCVIHRRQDQQ